METFILENNTTVTVSNAKLYKIGLKIQKPKSIYHNAYNNDSNSNNNSNNNNDSNSNNDDLIIETFYMLYPSEIKKRIKRYGGVLVYITEM